MTVPPKLTSHYLPADTAAWMAAQAVSHPALASVVVLAAFAAAVAVLRRRFGRGGADIFAFAFLFVALGLFAAACLYLLATRPGYRIFHPGF